MPNYTTKNMNQQTVNFTLFDKSMLWSLWRQANSPGLGGLLNCHMNKHKCTKNTGVVTWNIQKMMRSSESIQPCHRSGTFLTLTLTAPKNMRALLKSQKTNYKLCRTRFLSLSKFTGRHLQVIKVEERQH